VQLIDQFAVMVDLVITSNSDCSSLDPVAR